MNKRGFTLVELLAVIVILGVISMIAVPSVSKQISRSHDEAFVTEAIGYVDAVRTNILNGTYDAPVASNDVLVISLNYIEMEKEFGKSPYGANWVYNKCYVAVTNEGDTLSPKYAYYFAAQDEDLHAIPLTKIEDIDAKDVVYNARNTMEVTVQSLAGNIKGSKSKKGIISGLKNIKKNGKTVDWNVTIYTNQE